MKRSDRFLSLLEHLLASGFYNVRIEYAFCTRFSDDWTRENVIQKIEEAMKNGNFQTEFEATGKKGAS